MSRLRELREEGRLGHDVTIIKYISCMNLIPLNVESRQWARVCPLLAVVLRVSRRASDSPATPDSFQFSNYPASCNFFANGPNALLF